MRVKDQTQTTPEDHDVSDGMNNLYQDRSNPDFSTSISSTRLVHDVFDNIHNGVIITDKKGLIEWVNDGFVSLSGYNKDEVIGKKPGDLLQGEGTSPRHRSTFRRNLKKGIPFSQEVINYTKAGKKFWAYVQITPVLDDHGEAVKFIGIETDITRLIRYQERLKKSESNLRKTAADQLEISNQLKLTERKLKKALKEETKSRKQLQETQAQLVNNEKMASIGQLTAGIAHEINNPIAFVYNGIDALKITLESLFELTAELRTISESGDHENIVEQIREFIRENDFEEIVTDSRGLIEDVKSGAVRTMEIVKGLRIFSRLDEEEFKLADINENLDATLILLNNKIKKRIELTRNYDLELPRISCFPGQLNQVFMNILSNAIQAFPEDQPDPAIDISTSASDDGIAISIKDNGIGIPEKIRKRIFEPFFTTKPVGLGTGLGLSITYGIIEKHEGTIEVLSEPDVGTEFIITLPLRV